MAKEKHECPYCGKEMAELPFTEYGQKVWNGREWVKDFPFSNAEFRCSLCNGSLDFNDLEAEGVI